MSALNTMPSNVDVDSDAVVTVIRTTEQAVFDAIVDEALSHDPLASAIVIDGVARIVSEESVTIAVLLQP